MSDDASGAVQLRRVGVLGGVVEIHVVEPVDGHEMDVHVEDLKTGDQEPDFRRLESFLDGPADAAGDVHNVGRQVFVEVEPVVHLLPWDDKHVP